MSECLQGVSQAEGTMYLCGQFGSPHSMKYEQAARYEAIGSQKIVVIKCTDSTSSVISFFVKYR